MPSSGRQDLTSNLLSGSSIKSTFRAYTLPLVLFTASVFFQLVVLPHNYPPSYYDVLGLPRYSSVEEVTRAYEAITSKWNTSVEVPPELDLFKVQYAFELLTNEYLKRDYDVYNIDEHAQVLENVKKYHTGKRLLESDFPLINFTSYDPTDSEFELINSENFLTKFEDEKPLLIQIISYGSIQSAQFYNTWKRLVNFMNGVANTGVVELGDIHLVGYLAEKKISGQPFFRNGLPALLAFPPGCKSSSCIQRFEGKLSVGEITEWMATDILNLPRIPYYFKESLVQNFVAKSKPHQVKVILFSKTGERATPFIRQTAQNYSPYATFAFVLWKEEESAFWNKMFGLDSAPAVVILRDPGVEPFVYKGSINSSVFIDIMEKNKYHVLPQLRNITSAELGCDARGYSRAGNDTKIWYCAIAAGRPGHELRKLRDTMRRVQDKLSIEGEAEISDHDPSYVSATLALQQKRLTFVWLDGEVQSRYCFFHIHSEDSYETCGTRRGIEDVARLFIVRYERKSEDEKPDAQKQQRNVFNSWHQSEVDPTSTIVAKYNGSNDISEIISWISGTIKDGDSREIPPFNTRTPELVAEDKGQIWSGSSKKLVSSGISLKQRVKSIITHLTDRHADPRIGPSLLLVALMSFGRIWLNRNRPAQPENNNSDQQQERRAIPKEWQERKRAGGSNRVVSPLVPDAEPRGAQQTAGNRDSDSETE